MKKSFNETSGLATGLISATVLLLVAGCASKGPDAAAPAPGSGITEHLQIADEAHVALQVAVTALEKIRGQSNGVTAKAVQDLSDAINRVQVDSTRIRARSVAIHERGDAWFQNWHQNLSRIKDPELRALVDAKHPELKRSFEHIKSFSREGREHFEPFLKGLREIRNALEANPASASEPKTDELIHCTSEAGRAVEQCIIGIKSELEGMRHMLKLEATN